MSYLDDLLVSAAARVDDVKRKVTQEALEQRIAAVARPLDFAAALRARTPAIVAEIKRASPAKGDLDRDLNASELAGAYRAGGAAAISVLTEPAYFHGTLDDLRAAKRAGLPVLRKDFLLDPFQIFESRAEGADAVLLIVRILGDELDELLAATRALGMEALVEVHDDEDLERALHAGAAVIGINHRDLATFEVDPERTAKLAPRIPGDVVVVALSGVASAEDVRGLVDAGASAVLVGESLVTATDPAAKLRALLAG